MYCASHYSKSVLRIHHPSYYLEHQRRMHHASCHMRRRHKIKYASRDIKNYWTPRWDVSHLTLLEIFYTGFTAHRLISGTSSGRTTQHVTWDIDKGCTTHHVTSNVCMWLSIHHVFSTFDINYLHAIHHISCFTQRQPRMPRTTYHIHCWPIYYRLPERKDQNRIYHTSH